MLDRSVRTALIASVIVSFFVGGVMGGATGAFVALRPGLALTPALAMIGIRLPAAAKAEPEHRTVVEDSQTIDVVKTVDPAVVSIQISREVTRPRVDFSPFPFDDFFMPAPETDPGDGTPQLRIVGGGSGFLVSADGLIVTNRHVVDDAQASYTVVLSDGRKLAATVLARDPVLDLAIIDIEGDGFPTVTLGDSDALQVGQTVLAVGNTLAELQNTVTKGIISGIHRRITAGDGNGASEVIEEAIQTDAAINPGNSGGPLVNLSGQVIGVNVAVNASAQSVGFAVPINTAKQVITSVREHGRIIRPWIGVRYILISPEIAKAEHLPAEHGALVVRGDARAELAVIPGSPAEKAGIEENDIILSVDGEAIAEDRSLSALVGGKQPGDAVTLRVLHKGSEKTVIVTLGELKSQE